MLDLNPNIKPLDKGLNIFKLWENLPKFKLLPGRVKLNDIALLDPFVGKTPLSNVNLDQVTDPL